MAGKGDEFQVEIGVVDGQRQIDTLRSELRSKNEECEILKAKIGRLELDLVEARMMDAQHHSEASEVHKMKEVSEELLTKAKSIIFEKVKMCKNQELQIDALTAQVTSLKDVVAITKNLLEIRNMEVTHLQDQIDAMNGKVAAEKERQDIVHAKLDKMIRMNTELKREYETQLVLFNALRERYTERELAKNVVKDQDQTKEGNTTENNSSVSNGSAVTGTTVTDESTTSAESIQPQPKAN